MDLLYQFIDYFFLSKADEACRKETGNEQCYGCLA